MSGVRQTALVLHGLAAVDREWMLSQVSKERVGQLRALLAELEEVGIPADAALLRGNTRANGVALPNALTTHIAVLASASAEQVHALMVEEPDGLIALVLATTAWPWKEKFLSLLDVQRARRVAELALTMAAGTLIKQALVADLARRLTMLPYGAARNEVSTGRLNWSGWYRRANLGWGLWRR